MRVDANAALRIWMVLAHMLLILVNPWREGWSVCLSVCLFVCLRLFSHYRLRGGLSAIPTALVLQRHGK